MKGLWGSRERSGLGAVLHAHGRGPLSTWSQEVATKAGRFITVGLSSAIRRLGLCDHRDPSLSLYSMATLSWVRRNFHHGNWQELRALQWSMKDIPQTCNWDADCPKTSSEHQIFLWAEWENSWTYTTDPGSMPSFATGAVTHHPNSTPTFLSRAKSFIKTPTNP